jgi:hypothetical protein
MKLTKLADGEFSDNKDVPGLLSCRIDYEIKSGKGRLSYTGPKFSSEMWHQVMSFFRWTNKEMDSESQVRLYVNTKLGRWGAWAFPQEARTGMSAREITAQETPEQAHSRFASWDSEPSGDWLYFCTVHHHCSASAFQSSTDEENERDQDGLHITVGKMDADRHDIHARFYLAGNCFEPDMSLFWPIAMELAEQVPTVMLDQLARFQMCGKIVVDFPDQWRKNVIEVFADGHRAHGHQKDAQHQLKQPVELWSPRKIDVPEWMRAEAALKEISTHCKEEDFFALMHAIDESPDLNILVQVCIRHEVTPEDIIAEMQQYQIPF